MAIIPSSLHHTDPLRLFTPSVTSKSNLTSTTAKVRFIAGIPISQDDERLLINFGFNINFGILQQNNLLDLAFPMLDDVGDDPPLTAIGSIPVPQLHPGGSGNEESSEGEGDSEVPEASNDEEDAEGEQDSDASAIEKGTTEEEGSEDSDEQDLKGSEEQYSGDSEEEQDSQVEEGSNNEESPVGSDNPEYSDSSENSRQLRRFVRRVELRRRRAQAARAEDAARKRF